VNGQAMKKQRLFSPGETQMVSLGALSVLGESHQSPLRFVVRHLRGDFGAISDEEKQRNADAIKSGECRIISKFATASGQEIWVITEGGVTMVVTPLDGLV